MLPPRLSTDLTSLNQDEDRCAIVIEMQVGSDGKYTLTGIYPAWVRNKAKLAYHQVSDWLEKGFPDDQQHLKDQVVLQDQLAQKIKQYRLNVGTLTFDTIELQAQVINGQVVSIEELIHYRADEIIENLMIASNVSVSTYLKNNNLPTLKRIVKTPKNWDRIVQLAKQSGTNLPSEPSFIELAHFLNDQKQKNTQNFPDL
jgi:exoribonuclease-2